MSQVQPVGTKNNNGIAQLLAADAVGASLAVGADYMLQKSAFKHADRYLPLVKQQADLFAKAGLDTKEINAFVDFIKAKKVSNSSLFYAGLKGAAVAGLLYVGYDLVRKTAGKDDENFGSKTAVATGLGAIVGGLANYFSQKSIMNSMKSMRDNVQTLFASQLFVEQLDKKGLKRLKRLSDAFNGLTTAIGDGKVLKAPIAHAALRGGAYIGSAYVLYRGLKALFNRKPQPKVQLVEVPDELAKRLFKNAKNAQSVEDAEVIAERPIAEAKKSASHPVDDVEIMDE